MLTIVLFAYAFVAGSLFTYTVDNSLREQWTIPWLAMQFAVSLLWLPALVGVLFIHYAVEPAHRRWRRYQRRKNPPAPKPVVVVARQHTFDDESPACTTCLGEPGRDVSYGRCPGAQTGFDRYLDERMKDPEFRAEFERARAEKKE